MHEEHGSHTCSSIVLSSAMKRSVLRVGWVNSALHSQIRRSATGTRAGRRTLQHAVERAEQRLVQVTAVQQGGALQHHVANHCVHLHAALHCSDSQSRDRCNWMTPRRLNRSCKYSMPALSAIDQQGSLTGFCKRMRGAYKSGRHARFLKSISQRAPAGRRCRGRAAQNPNASQMSRHAQRRQLQHLQARGDSHVTPCDYSSGPAPAGTHMPCMLPCPIILGLRGPCASKHHHHTGLLSVSSTSLPVRRHKQMAARLCGCMRYDSKPSYCPYTLFW